MDSRLARDTLLIALLLGAGACLPSNLLAGARPLPTASATLHGVTVDMPRGSYCWSSGGHGECADSAGPEALLRTGYLKPNRTPGGFDVKITFHSATQPSTFHVQLFQSPDGTAGPVRESGTRAFSLGASPPAPAGTYVYVVTGTWPEGDVGFFLAVDLIPGVA